MYKSILLKVMLVLLAIAVTQPAYSIVQLRLNYGLGQPDGFDSNNIDYNTGEFGGDVIVSIPLIPIVFGLRYESITAEETNNGVKEEIDLSRISLVGGYRFLDTLFFLGTLVTYGIINDGEMSFEQTTKTVNEIDMSNSITLGLEGGVKLNGFIFGAELGYRYGKDKGQSASDFDYTGTYAKALLGYDF